MKRMILLLSLLGGMNAAAQFTPPPATPAKETTIFIGATTNVTVDGEVDLTSSLAMYGTNNFSYGESRGIADYLIGASRMTQLESIPYIQPSVRTYEASSFKRIAEWADFDAHLYTYNGEKVIFHEEGQGVINRLWVTAVHDVNSKIKFYFDGEAVASGEFLMPELFHGNVAGGHGFPYPLSSDEGNSAGGRINYSPVYFAESLIVTDAGSDLIDYYNITYDLYPKGTVLGEPSGALLSNSSIVSYLNQTGSDPKSASGNKNILTASSISAGAVGTLLDISGKGVVQSIEFDLAPATLDILTNSTITMTFDGVTTVDAVPLGEFFGSAVGEVDVLSLPIGMRTSGNWYCYFPLPFWSSAKITIENNSANNIASISADVAYNDQAYDPARAGYFHAEKYSKSFVGSDGDMVFFDRSGVSGKFVGLSLYVTGDSIGTGGMMYLEGDARIYIDGAKSPSIHGTGNEDWFNAAFYYNDFGDGGANQSAELFSMPYHGLPAKNHYDAPNNWTQAYRFNLADPINFTSGMLFTMEHGGYPWFTTGEYSAIAYSYQRRTSASYVAAQFHTDRGEEYGYTSDGGDVSVASKYITPKAEIDAQSLTFTGKENVTTSSFSVRINPNNRGVILRSLVDFSAGTNTAVVSISNVEAGKWTHVDLNYTNSPFAWGIKEVVLPASMTEGLSRLDISIDYSAPATEYEFTVLCLSESTASESPVESVPFDVSLLDGLLDEPTADTLYQALNNAAIGTDAYVDLTSRQGAAMGLSATNGEYHVGADNSYGGGGAIGQESWTSAGGAIGMKAYSIWGGAVGILANTWSGGAVGQNAASTKGFAGGVNAKANADDNIQLGAGTNPNNKTLGVYSYEMMDATGNVPIDRMSSAGDGRWLLQAGNPEVVYTAVSNATTYAATMRWDATNKVFIVTEEAL